MMDIEDFFDDVRCQYRDKLPFVAYRKPNEATIKALLQEDEEIHFSSDYTESGFVFSPFDDSKSAVLIPFSKSKSIQSVFVSSIERKSSPNDVLTNQDQRQFHISVVQKGIEAINSNDFKKVVLSRRENVTLEECHPIHIFSKLLNSYDNAFVYCWYHPKIGLWLGATPETLLKIEGNRLTTMALAGTQKFNGTLDVVWPQKEIEEQQFVTDFIVSGLKSSVKNLTVFEAETVRAGNLVHIKTIISANFQAETLNLKQLLKAIHPTPAVCGLPKEQAKQFILENEGYEREFYTGFLGELNVKEKTSRNSNRRNVENDAYASIKTVSNLYVNLRCMQLKDNQAIIYVGGGITKDSVPESEWEETVSKSQVIKSIL